jgi:hypothetical protein
MVPESRRYLRMGDVSLRECGSQRFSKPVWPSRTTNERQAPPYVSPPVGDQPARTASHRPAQCECLMLCKRGRGARSDRRRGCKPWAVCRGTIPLRGISPARPPGLPGDGHALPRGPLLVRGRGSPEFTGFGREQISNVANSTNGADPPPSIDRFSSPLGKRGGQKGTYVVWAYFDVWMGHAATAHLNSICSICCGDRGIYLR